MMSVATPPFRAVLNYHYNGIAMARALRAATIAPNNRVLERTTSGKAFDYVLLVWKY